MFPTAYPCGVGMLLQDQLGLVFVDSACCFRISLASSSAVIASSDFVLIGYSFFLMSSASPIFCFLACLSLMIWKTSKYNCSSLASLYVIPIRSCCASTDTLTGLRIRLVVVLFVIFVTGFSLPSGFLPPVFYI